MSCAFHTFIHLFCACLLSLSGTIYNGEFQSGMRHGFGVLIDKILGDVYVGQFVNDNKEGSGRMHYGNGDQYVGSWLDDVRHGDASIHYADPNGRVRLQL